MVGNLLYGGRGIEVFPIHQESYKILYNSPVFTPGPVLSLTAPFEWTAWAGTFLGIGVITVALVVPNKITSFFHVLLEVIGSMMLSQGMKSRKFKFIFATWSLSFFLLVQYYEGGLKSFATVPMVQKSMKTFADLMQENCSINTLLNWKNDAVWTFHTWIRPRRSNSAYVQNYKWLVGSLDVTDKSDWPFVVGLD
ncbi:unnamed protein product, partial [Allacma fusca]